MELINTLIVKHFPGMKDGTYKFSQDVVISGRSGSGKTSILKAITWLLVGKDLQGNTIPNIYDDTSVVSRGELTLKRTGSNQIEGNLHKILKGKTADILSRIVPGYILGGALTNKAVVEALTGYNMDTYTGLPSMLSNATKKTIPYYKELINKLQSSQKKIYNISMSIVNLSRMYPEYHLLDRISTFEDLQKVSIFLQSNGGLLQVLRRYRRKMETLSSDEDILKEIGHILKVFSGDATMKYISELIFGKSSSVNSAMCLERVIQSIDNTMSATINTLNARTNREPSAYATAYGKVLKETFTLTETKTLLQRLKDSLYRSINNKLESYGMTISMNNVINYNIIYKEKEVSLLELPSRERFLYEVNLCSRLQTVYINNNNSNRERDVLGGLILIDDYRGKCDNDGIDLVLSEGHHHQVFLTYVDEKDLAINING